MEIKRLPKELELRPMRDFGAEIRQMRLDCGLSQQELALKVGLGTATAISLIESNKRSCSVRRFDYIVTVCGLSLEIYSPNPQPY